MYPYPRSIPDYGDFFHPCLCPLSRFYWRILFSLGWRRVGTLKIGFKLSSLTDIVFKWVSRKRREIAPNWPLDFISITFGRLTVCHESVFSKRVIENLHFHVGFERKKGDSPKLTFGFNFQLHLEGSQSIMNLHSPRGSWKIFVLYKSKPCVVEFIWRLHK